MAEFLLDGRAIDWILGLVALEAVALALLRHLWRRGPSPLALVGNLLSGAFLLLALRNALAGASPGLIGLCLAGSLVAHLADLAARWESPADAAGPRSAAARVRATISVRVDKPPVRQSSFPDPAPRAPKDESSDA